VDYSIKISRSARLEINSAISWYNEQKPKLGDNFLLSFESKIQFIKSFPQASPFFLKDKGVRYKFISTFPYIIYYKVTGNTIVILAVLHTSKERNESVY